MYSALLVINDWSLFFFLFPVRLRVRIIAHVSTASWWPRPASECAKRYFQPPPGVCARPHRRCEKLTIQRIDFNYHGVIRII